MAVPTATIVRESALEIHPDTSNFADGEGTPKYSSASARLRTNLSGGEG